MQDTSMDGRRHYRFETMEYVQLSEPNTKEPFSAVIVDISLGGLQLRSRNICEAGKVYHLQIGQGEQEPIEAEIEIRYCKPVDGSDLNSIGVKFMPAQREKRMRLVQYIHQSFSNQVNQFAS